MLSVKALIYRMWITLERDIRRVYTITIYAQHHNGLLGQRNRRAHPVLRVLLESAPLEVIQPVIAAVSVLVIDHGIVVGVLEERIANQSMHESLVVRTGPAQPDCEISILSSVPVQGHHDASRDTPHPAIAAYLVPAFPSRYRSPFFHTYFCIELSSLKSFSISGSSIYFESNQRMHWMPFTILRFFLRLSTRPSTSAIAISSNFFIAPKKP